MQGLSAQVGTAFAGRLKRARARARIADAWQEIAALNRLGNANLLIPCQGSHIPLRLRRWTFADARLKDWCFVWLVRQLLFGL